MHNNKNDFKLIIFAKNDFINSILELKEFFKFDISTAKNNDFSLDDILMIHEDVINENDVKNVISDSKNIKILVSKVEKQAQKGFYNFLKLPVTINEINKTILDLKSRYNFAKNSSLKIKDYFLDKNQKILEKEKKKISLTEKEIKLLELLLDSKKPISKNFIQKTVWEYSEEADTHTVETHIYRLRKKIADEFKDEKFILNSKDGYYL